jgi:hypothetical protein
VKVERVRAFYTRKIDDMQRKHEAHIRQLKREPHAASENEEANDVSSADPEGFRTESKLVVLEDELLKTAEELGQTQKALSEKIKENEDLNRRIAQLSAAGHSNDQDIGKLIQAEVDRLFADKRSQQMQLPSVQTVSEGEIRSKYEAGMQRLRDELDVRNQENRAAASKFDAEREHFYRRLHDEIDKSAQLAARVTMLEAEANKPLLPQQHQFNVGLSLTELRLFTVLS